MRITDPFGRVVAFTYTAGLLTKVTDPFGRETTLAYDGSDRLTSITRPDPDGAGSLAAPVVSFDYDATTHLMTEWTNAENETTEFTYDSALRLSETTYADSSVRELSPAHVQGLVDPGTGVGTSGNPAAIVKPADVSPSVIDQLDNESTFTTDRFGRFTSWTDAEGNTTFYERNADGRLTKLTLPDPDGAGTLTSPIYQYEYDENGNVTQLSDATHYEIGGRGHEVAEQLLGIDYSGVLVHDGWSPYDRFLAAAHQQCNAHALRRAQELLETSVGPATRFPRAVRDLLRKALAWRDRYRETVSQGSRERAYDRYTSRLEALVSRDKTDAANQRFTKHLRKHLYAWFWYLTDPTLDATNWRAEQAIRPAVVNRKVWGGNRTWLGARAQTMLTSIITTCRQRTHNALNYLIETLQSPAPFSLPAGR